MKNLNSHTRQMIAIFITLNVYFFTYKQHIEIMILLIWCAYSGVNLILDWLIILKNTAADVKKMLPTKIRAKYSYLFLLYLGHYLAY